MGNEKLIVFDSDGNPKEIRFYDHEKLVARLGVILDKDNNSIGLRELDIEEVSPPSWLEKLFGMKKPKPRIDITTVDFIGLINWINTINKIKSIDLISLITQISKIVTIETIQSMPPITVVGSEGVALQQTTAGAGAWNVPTGSSGTDWLNPENARDNDTATYSEYLQIIPQGWSSFLSITFSSAIKSNKLRFWVSRETSHVDLIDIDVLVGGVWVHAYEDAFSVGAYSEKPFSQGLVTEIKLRFHSIGTSYKWVRVHEVGLWSVPTTGGLLKVQETA